jgi:hypothetical protein
LCAFFRFRTALVPSCASPINLRAHAMSRFTQRQHTARVLEALEGRVKQFRRREELWPLRVPGEPIAIDAVIDEALGAEGRSFGPDTLRTRTLLQLEWNAETIWEVWMIALPSKTKIYLDSDGYETRVLASGGRNDGDENDRVFLNLLAETAGSAFGIEFAGGAPARVRSSIADRAFLVDFFVNLFEVTGGEASVREAIAGRDHASPLRRDFQQDVAEWLEIALGVSPTPRPPS